MSYWQCRAEDPGLLTPSSVFPEHIAHRPSLIHLHFPLLSPALCPTASSLPPLPKFSATVWEAGCLGSPAHAWPLLQALYPGLSGAAFLSEPQDLLGEKQLRFPWGRGTGLKPGDLLSPCAQHSGPDSALGPHFTSASLSSKHTHFPLSWGPGKDECLSQE